MSELNDDTVPTEPNDDAALVKLNDDANKKKDSHEPVHNSVKERDALNPNKKRKNNQSILIGDIQVRNITKNFCPNSKNKIVHCYPHIDACNATDKTTGILGVVQNSE